MTSCLPCCAEAPTPAPAVDRILSQPTRPPVRRSCSLWWLRPKEALGKSAETIGKTLHLPAHHKSERPWLETSGLLEKWTVAAAMSDGQVKGAEFVRASKAIISIFDLISGMGVAKRDMEGNANTIGRNLTVGQSIQACVDAEMARGVEVQTLVHDGKCTTCALLWLTRALRFIVGLMRALLSDSSKSLKDAVLAGYEISLKPHHGFATKAIFSVRAAGANPRPALSSFHRPARVASAAAAVLADGRQDGAIACSLHCQDRPFGRGGAAPATTLHQQYTGCRSTIGFLLKRSVRASSCFRRCWAPSRR